ncbi:nitrilase and fragile histidine triad fusion protein NitFhit, partial [Contarinia nasturtii]|uniref:nitrilase and fragile histidine triad fusion protein NitFhit n=1 Tax=Contarinia nasturtii TaxID=265458 RepID=UPI0012D4253D
NNEKTDKMHNSHIVINNAGELVAVYRKLHLFDVETSEFRFQESKVISSGNNLVSPLTDTPLQGGLGLLICYDLRFPEASTILRKNGATYLTYPSAFAYATGLAHWESLLRARAIENQCYVFAATQIGYHNEKRRSFGHGMIVDPWGKILAECDKDDASVPQCITASISLDLLNDTRKRMPCFSHRRDEVYTLAPHCMIPADKSVCTKDSEFLTVENEKSPYFIFEKNPIPKSTTFLETPSSIAFTNISCVVTGHILVATRRCVSRLKDLTPEEIVDFFMAVCKCQRMLEEYYKTTSCTVTVQDGEFAGQTVRHVHCHVMPRKEGDFKHNDEIYIELNKHDHPKDGERRSFRSVEERTAEANEYRKILAKSKFF